MANLFQNRASRELPPPACQEFACALKSLSPLLKPDLEVHLDIWQLTSAKKLSRSYVQRRFTALRRQRATNNLSSDTSMELLPISPTLGKHADTDADLPSGRPKKFPRVDRLFVLVVILPVALATLYYGFIASDVYISESSFVVRAPQKPSTTGLGAILQSVGFSNASEEMSAAESYAVSRDALRAINKGGAFERAFTRPEISIVDRFNPFGVRGSFEDLYKYFTGKVSLQNDSATSITKLTVRAYTPEDAHRFNEQLLELSERTVNRLNARGREDLVRFAQAEVDQAQARASQAAVALAAYRNRVGVVDPEKQAEVQMQMVSKLQDSLIGTKTELTQLQRYTPENPRIPVLQSQIGTIQHEIDRQMGQVAGNHRSLAASAVQFQRLTLASDFATKQLGAALASLQDAQDEARRKQAYVERIVEPNVPDSPLEPRRLRNILATLVVSLIAYAILRMFVAGVKEHAQ
jgi:capsular polysaccharide transport system permease protein